MAKEKSPAFQFYPKDFLTDERVRLMSHQERGVYITLLCMCWQEGSLPAKPEHLARLVGMANKPFKRLWDGPVGQCFYVSTEEVGRVGHKRLDEERGKQEIFRRRQSDKGKVSAANRKATDTQPNGNRGSTAVQPDTQPALVQPKGNSSSAICNLQSAPSGRGTPPLALGLTRLKIWRWQVEEFIAQLGEHADAFDVDEWIHARDRTETRVITDWKSYWREEFRLEVQRRQLPLAAPAPAAKSTAHRDAILGQLRS